MFTDTQLEILAGILTRRHDLSVTPQDYDDMLHMVKSEQNVRRHAKRRLDERAVRARRSAVESPIVPDPFNDPLKW